MNEQAFSNLRQFLGGYFHQDFLLDYASPDDAIMAFMNEAPPEFLQVARAELEEVIPLVEQVQDPETFLADILWCSYYPSADGLTVADWLKHIRQKLRASALPTSSQAKHA